MKEHPTIFNAEMVRAILADRKTHTRRVIKPQPGKCLWLLAMTPFWSYALSKREWKCPYGVPGDRLWVRETFYRIGETNQIFYRADNSNNFNDPLFWGGPWKPSIFMPRSANRIILEVLDIRVERVQEHWDKLQRSEGWMIVVIAIAVFFISVGIVANLLLQ